MSRNTDKPLAPGNPSAESSPLAAPRLRVMLGHAIAIGPGKAELLGHIAASGSISAAARQMGMSYRRAWLLVDTMNQCFREPLVETAAGGRGGGGARLSALGHEVLRRYQEMERVAGEAVAEPLAEFQQLLNPEPPQGE